MPTNKPEVVLPELPAITRYRVDGDIAYPVSEDPDGSMVDYDDHVAAMRAYGQACIDTLTPPADGDFVMVPREPTDEMLEAYQEAMCGIRNITSVDDNELVILWKAMLSAAPQQPGQEVGACSMCGGRGEIGGFVGIDSGYQTDPCPDCAKQPAEAVAWRSPDEAPTVPAGGMDFFWVAVRRKHNGKVYSFPAAYLNSMSLDNDDFPIEQVRQGNRYVEVPPGEHDDGCMVATGWYSAKEHSDYDTLYSALLDSTDELVAWRPVADYPNTSPPPAIDIGKLRELEAGWRRYDCVFSPDAQAFRQCANELAALIGDGGER